MYNSLNHCQDYGRRFLGGFKAILGTIRHLRYPESIQQLGTTFTCVVHVGWIAGLQTDRQGPQTRRLVPVIKQAQ